MTMKSLFKFVFLLFLAGLAAMAVASIVANKRLETMSEEEIRAYLDAKLGDKIGDGQLAKIQDAVIGRVHGKRPSADQYIQDVEEAVDELRDVAEAATDSPDAVDENSDKGPTE